MMMTERTVDRTGGDPLRRLVVALSAADLDHAAERNAAGWSASHTTLGHALAVTEPWSPAARRMAWEMVRHYRRQAAQLGVDVDTIAEPPDPGQDETTEESHHLRSLVDGMELAEDDEGRLVLREAPTGTVTLTGSQWVIRSGYDAALVAALRQLRGAAWDAGERVWRVPATTDLVDQLADTAEAHRLAVVDADGRRATDPRTVLGSVAVAPPAADATPKAGTARLSAGTWRVATEYNPELVAIIREAPGRRWDRDTKRWTIPDSAPGREVLRRLEAAGVQVAWPADAPPATTNAAATKAPAATPRRNVVEAAGLTTELRPWQREAVERIVGDPGGWLLADDMGLGKSLTALTVVRAERRQRVVVLCPRSLRSVWVAQAAAHFASGWAPFLPSGRRATPIPADTTMVVVHYDIAAGWQQAITAWAPDALILDESHAVKAAKANRSKTAAAIAEVVRGRGGRVLLLSGTPAPNHPSDLLHQLRIAGRLDQLGGWRRMAEAAGLERGRWGWEQVDVTPERAAQLRERLASACMIRRTRAEVAGDLVPLDPVVARVELPASALAGYRAAEASIVSYLRDRAAAIAETAGGDPRRAVAAAERALDAAPNLVSIAVLRRLVGEAKASAAVEYVRELLGDDGGADTVLGDSEPTRVLVFAHHRDVLRETGDALDAPVIDGETPEADRARLVEEFQAGKHRVLVLGLGVGGEGLTLTAANVVVHAEWGWTAAAHQQAEARAARLGQTRPVTSHYLVAPDTIDEAVASVVAGKAAWGAALMASGPQVESDPDGGNLGCVALAALLARASAADLDE